MTTPMRRQYLQIKKQFPDAILFFRLGDFYETFDGDAEIVAQVCDIVLTSRPVGKDMRVPLAGVPYHAVDGYVAKLINAGYKVAIAEQSGESGRGLMTREVSSVVTPGTVTEPTLLDSRTNNYLAAVLIEGDGAGVAYADITTGEFVTTQIPGPAHLATVLQELDRIRPAECLVPQATGDKLGASLNGSGRDVRISVYDAWRFELDTAREALLSHLGVATLEGFGCAHLPLAVRAAGAIVQYIGENQRGVTHQLPSLTTYALGDFMVLDAATRRNLELLQTIREGRSDGALLGVLDRTLTPMGGRLLRRWISQPLLDMDKLAARQEAVEGFFMDTARREAARALLKMVGDLERLAQRASLQRAMPRELGALRDALRVIPELRQVIECVRPARAPLDAVAESMDERPEVVSLLTAALTEEPPVRLDPGRVIARGFSAELDSVALAATNAKEWISRLEETERARTGIRNLKVGYNKVFGYYIEISKANLTKAPTEYVRKQTLVNAERYITPELKEKETLILNAQERLLELETRIYGQVCAQVAGHASHLMVTAHAVAALDAYVSLAEVAARNNYIRPELVEGDIVDIRTGRHPVVELALGPSTFVPNDVHLDVEQRILIITGPNMAGKSTILRQIALIVLMAQMGSFVPADSATIGVIDRIFTRVGAQDDIGAGQSTFMVEMVEVANILNNATSRSLLILDEVGRGTSTYDGISLAWATVEHIHNHPRLQAKTLFATHYHELTELAEILPRVHNFNVAVAEMEGKVVFLHRLAPGSADRSYGIHVAQLAGLPRSVIHRAEEILEELEEQSPSARSSPRHSQAGVQQLSLFVPESPLLEELRKIDILSLTPLEAITRLFELQQKAKQS